MNFWQERRTKRKYQSTGTKHLDGCCLDTGLDPVLTACRLGFLFGGPDNMYGAAYFEIVNPYQLSVADFLMVVPSNFCGTCNLI